MKKLFNWICIVLLFLCISTTANALPVGTGTQVGGYVDGVVYLGTDTPSPGPSLFNPKHKDSEKNVNLIIDKYNTVNFSSLPTAYFSYKNEGISNQDLKDGSFSVTPGTEYISMKWGVSDGGWYLWYVADIDFASEAFNFTGLSKGLSHYTEWGSTPVPEPATMLLFGFGLLGLAGVSRKK